MKVNLKVWRQKNNKAQGALKDYAVVKDLTVERSAFDRIIAACS